MSSDAMQQVYFQAYLNLFLSGAVHNRWAPVLGTRAQAKNQMNGSKITANIPGFKWRSTVSLSTLQEAGSIINLTLIPYITNPKLKYYITP